MIFKNWIDVLLRKLENGLQDAELADALDRISQFIMGPDAYKKLKVVTPHFELLVMYFSRWRQQKTSSDTSTSLAM